jgi:hypothetical protein
MERQENVSYSDSKRKKVVIDGGQAMRGLQAVYEIEFTESELPRMSCSEPSRPRRC